jgi:hypothetical protein
MPTKYSAFFTALSRAQIITNPTIHMASLHSIAAMCMVGLERAER